MFCCCGETLNVVYFNLYTNSINVINKTMKEWQKIEFYLTGQKKLIYIGQYNKILTIEYK